MSSSRIPSPARSQGVRATPRRYKPRASRSVCSPGRSTSSVKLSAVVMSQMDFELSPLPTRRSVLSDTTDIEAPRRRSWWKKLNENSREIMEALNNKETADVNAIEEFIEVDVQSQEKENYTLDLPESSDNESISSIIIPQRILFTQKENQQQNKFAHIIDTRKSLAKVHKSHVMEENDLSVGPKNLFNNGTRQRNKPIFPSGLLNISANKNLANKTKEATTEVHGQVKSLFGSRPGTKRKNMFVDFIVSDIEDEIPEIQPKIFEFQKVAEQSRKPTSNHRHHRESSPSSITDIEIDEWRLLPSSTMVDHQLEDGLGSTPNKRTRLGKLSEATESTANKSKLSNKSMSMKNKSKNILNFKEIQVTEIIVPTHDLDDQNNITRKSLRKTNISTKNISHERSLRSQNNSLNKSKKKPNKSTNNTTNLNQDKANHSKSTELGNREFSYGIESNQDTCDKQNNSECNNADNNIERNQYKKPISQKVMDINRDKEMQHNSMLKERVNNDKDEENKQIGEVNLAENNSVIENDENALILENQNDQNDVQEANKNTQDGSEDSDENICLRMEENEEELQENYVESKVEGEEEKANKNNTDANDSQDMVDGDKMDTSKLNDSQENVKDEEEIRNDYHGQSDIENQEANAENDNQEIYNDKEVQDESGKESDHNTDNEEEEVQKEDKDISEAENTEIQDSHDSNLSAESDDSEEMLEDEEDNNDNTIVIQEIKNDNEVGESEIEDDAQITNNSKSLEDMQEIETSHENENHEVELESAEDDDEDRVEIQCSRVNDEEEDSQGDDDQNDSQDEIDNNMEAEDEIDEDREVEERDHSGEEDEIGEIEESVEADNQTTIGRHRKKPSNLSSPEAPLYNKTNQMDSFAIQGPNTSVRKTKSMIKALNIKPSLAPRESIGLPDGTRESSAEGSGWDSHRTTRVTLRKTFGKDFTPRKSLRTLVMEKSAKRQTMANSAEPNAEISKFPQANSTELPAEESIDMQDDDIDDVQESDHEASRRQRQTTLEMYLQKVKTENMERRKQLQEEVRNSLNAPKKDAFNFFKIPAVPKRRAPLQKKPKTKPITSSVIPFDMLPPQLLEDMKYKPPKRYRPASASWITKRLYNYLETKLEPKYDYKARVRSEKLVEMIYEFTKSVRRHTSAPADAVNELKHVMARLQIVKTHFEFYEFFHEFMPREVTVKVVPDAFNNIPIPKHGVFSDILR